MSRAAEAAAVPFAAVQAATRWPVPPVNAGVEP
jgi:hypothetical protein